MKKEEIQQIVQALTTALAVNAATTQSTQATALAVNAATTQSTQATIESFEIDKDYISLKLKRLNLKTKTKKGKDMLVLSKTNFFERFKVKIDGKEIEVKASFMIYI